MKANELKQLIQQLVKEEVATEINKAMSRILVEMVKEIKGNETINEAPNTPAEIPIIRTNNPKLNSVLSETARNFKPMPKTPGTSLVELMDGGFEKIGKHETIVEGQPKTKLDFLKQMVNESVQVTPSALDGGVAVPDALKKVFNRDFRAVLKKSKEQAGGGFFNAAAVLSGTSETPT